jgi:hypothetical protein
MVVLAAILAAYQDAFKVLLDKATNDSVNELQLRRSGWKNRGADLRPGNLSALGRFVKGTGFRRCGKTPCQRCNKADGGPFKPFFGLSGVHFHPQDVPSPKWHFLQPVKPVHKLP